MTLLMGIDEAGYGPNLGPFVMSSALFSVPNDNTSDLWKALQTSVRKASQKTDGRLVVDDSKLVYSPVTGIGVLEKNIWPFIQLKAHKANTLSELWQALCLTPSHAVQHEPYLQWDKVLPQGTVSVSSQALLQGNLNQSGIRLEQLQSCIIMPRQFNQLTQEYDSKAAVPLTCIKELVARLPTDERVEITIDRLGGRQHYLQQVKQWFPDSSVSVISETTRCSRYQIDDRISIQFLVQADQQSFSVALASMLSKYWRELIMSQFNAWFSSQLPGLKPTAGYPVDASRFWNDIEPLRKSHRFVVNDWWRER